MVVYRYQVPADKTKRYIMLQRQTAQVYLEHGCLEVEVYRDAKDQRYWMEIYRFEDKERYEDAVAEIEKDHRIEAVTKEFISLFGAGEYQPERRVYFRMF